MPDVENVKKEDLVDVGEKEGAEIELDKKAEGGEVKDEQTTQDSNKSDDTSKKLDESVDVRDSSDSKEPVQEKKEEVKQETEKKDTEQKQEMDEYSEGVKKRIAKLTRKMREAERQKEEAVSYAKRVMQERDQLSHQATTYEKDYTSEMENRIQSSLAAAQAKLAASREADDKKAEVEALTAISQLGYEQGKLAEIKSRQAIEEKEAKAKPTLNTQPPRQTPAPDPKAEEWAEKNEWFGKDNAMTYTAFDLHRKLTEEEGYDPKSDSYYEEINKRIRLEFPHKFGNTTEKTISRPTQNVASATRSSKTGRKTVKLTPSQVAIAKKLRVPLEEYARQLKLTKEE
jgi:hypothetical protein